ncbi:MAG: amidohydrolase family protein [Phycisphaerales bacterium]
MSVGTVLDADGTAAAPGAVAWEIGVEGRRRILAAGPPEVVIGVIGDRRWVETHRPGALVVPGLVNAHVHLDLTDVGRQPFDGDFVSWVKMLQGKRDGSEQGVRQAVRRGAAMSWAAGVTTVGDIAWWRGAEWSIDELRKTGLRGVAFAEIIGLDEQYPTQPMRSLRQAMAMERDAGGVRVGLEAHAPYSTGRGIYEAVTKEAERENLAVCTHLAEMEGEFDFVRNASGIFRGFMEELGAWREEYAAMYDGGLRPVRWMEEWLRRRRWLLAHCNEVNDEEIELLAKCGASVAYCPRASEYFGHGLRGRGHRYREMMEAGVNVCLGTDSIVCHGSLSIIDEMRRLHERDGTDAMMLLRMGTVNGVKALGLAGESGWIVIEDVAKNVTDAREAWENVLKSDRKSRIEVIE